MVDALYGTSEQKMVVFYGFLQGAGKRRDEPILLEGEALRRRDPTMIHSPRVVLQRLSFGIVELRLFLSKLLALRLTLSDLGYMRIAWNEIKTFEAHASSYLERLNSDE